MEELTRQELIDLFNEEVGFTTLTSKEEAISLFRGYKEYIKSIIEEERARRINIKIMPFAEWRKLKDVR